MSSQQDKVRDPVCDMWVDPQNYEIEFEGMRFAFCSRQCQERFLANPRLYIGRPGVRSPKQQGENVFKRRRLKLEEPLSEQQRTQLVECVQAMMGIKAIEVKGDCVDITYDLLEATEAQIESEIAHAGAVLGQGWSDRLRRAFMNYLEEAELENLELHTSKHPHCH